MARDISARARLMAIDRELIRDRMRSAALELHNLANLIDRCETTIRHEYAGEECKKLRARLMQLSREK